MNRSRQFGGEAAADKRARRRATKKREKLLARAAAGDVAAARAAEKLRPENAHHRDSGDAPSGDHLPTLSPGDIIEAAARRLAEAHVARGHIPAAEHRKFYQGVPPELRDSVTARSKQIRRELERLAG